MICHMSRDSFYSPVSISIPNIDQCHIIKYQVTKKKKKKTPVYEKQIKLENYWNNELIIR